MLELVTESDQETHQVGDIFIGKVERVLPGLACAFVDLGLARAGFLPTQETRHAELFHPVSAQSQAVLAENTVINVGSPVLAQVVRAQEGDKGPRLSLRISLASALIVYVPLGHGVRVSRKIKSEATRRRLESVGRLMLQDEAGAFVFRTLAEDANDAQLILDMTVLCNQWRSLQSRSKRSQVARLVEARVAAPLNWIADWMNPGLTSITVDAATDFQTIREALGSGDSDQPLISQVRLDAVLAHQSEFHDQVRRLLDRRVALPSGGYLVIDEAEALVAIDVNTGSFVAGQLGSSGHYQTNLEAALVIADELRLRRIAGIVVVDFIDMDEAEDQRSVRRQLMKGLARDPVRSEVSEFSRLGLIEISRAKTGASLLRLIEPNRPAREAAKASADRLFGANPAIQIQDWVDGFERAGGLSQELVVEIIANQWVVRQLLDDQDFSQFSQRENLCLQFQIQDHISTGLQMRVNGQLMALPIGSDAFE